MYSFLFPEDVVSGLPLMPLNVIRTTVLYSLRIQMSALYVGVFHCSLWFCWFSFTVFYFTVPPPPAPVSCVVCLCAEEECTQTP